MKTTLQHSFITFLFATALISCDKIEEATNITVDSNEKISLSFNLTGGVAVSESNTYDLSTNSDISKYLDNLKGVSIKDAYYVISGFTDNSSETVTGNFSFTLANQTFGPFENTFKADLASAKKTPFDVAKLNAVGTKLFEDKKITISIEGSHNIPSNSTVAETVTIDLHLQLEFTASPL